MSLKKQISQKKQLELFEKKRKIPEFKKRFEEEKQLLSLSYIIADARKREGYSQQELARKSHISQQQLSKVENGINCNMLTFIRVSNALGLDFSLN